MTSLEMANSTFTSQPDRIFTLLNNAIYHRTTSILGKVHAAFFNYHQFNEMTHIPNENVLARIMTALDLQFKRVLLYPDKGYESNNDYGLPTQVMRHVCVYSVSTTETSFNPTYYKEAHCPISPLTPR